MIEYPFSGMIPNFDYVVDTDTNIKSQVENLVNRYCFYYGISPTTLIKFSKKRNPNRVYSGVHLDFMRMALAFYLKRNFPITHKEAGQAVGYSDHSTPVKNQPCITHYIQTKDPYFYPYWETLLKIA